MYAFKKRPRSYHFDLRATIESGSSSSCLSLSFLCLLSDSSFFLSLSLSLSFFLACRVSRAHSRSPLPASRLGRFYFIFIPFCWKRLDVEEGRIPPRKEEFLRASLVFFFFSYLSGQQEEDHRDTSVDPRERREQPARSRSSVARSLRRLTFYLSPLAKPIGTRTRAVVTVSRKYIVRANIFISKDW